MPDPKPVVIVMMKRSPPMWSVKVGARYVRGFLGEDAKRRAIKYATTNYGPVYSIREKPPQKAAKKSEH